MHSFLSEELFHGLVMKQSLKEPTFSKPRWALIKQRRRHGICACWSNGHRRSETKPANYLLLNILICCSLFQCGEAWKQGPSLASYSGFHGLAALLLLHQTPCMHAAPLFRAELVISEINVHGPGNDQVQRIKPKFDVPFSKSFIFQSTEFIELQHFASQVVPLGYNLNGYRILLIRGGTGPSTTGGARIEVTITVDRQRDFLTLLLTWLLWCVNKAQCLR